MLGAFDDRGAMASGGEAGSYDIDVRLREMDAEGCACEILHSGTQAAPPLWYGVANRRHDPELQFAGARAYHRWLADFMAASHGRLVGVAEPGPCLDMEATVKELEWLADHGFVSVGVPGIVADPSLPPLYDSYYEPFFAACADLGLVLSVHAGWGSAQGAVYAFFDLMARTFGDVEELDRTQIETLLQGQLAESKESPFRLDLGPRQVMWQLMLGGAFDRHPRLRLSLTEIRADWVPATLQVLDRMALDTKAPLSKSPTEYYRQHCAVTPSSIHLCEIAMRHEIGVENLLFGMDYPHHEGTWPNTRAWIQVALAGVPETEARAILGENAIALYGLDRSALAAVAAEIGPAPSEVLVTEHQVRSGLIEHFHKRAGFTREPETVDVAVVEAAFRSDLAGSVTSSR
jgi:predicted TIM-barrel fold metal-dependent hydrolase